MVHDIAFAKDNQAWLATSFGLVQFDGVVWTRWGSRAGIPESAVTAVEFDSQGDLWIGTEHGLGSLRERTFRRDGSLGSVGVRRLVSDARNGLWLCTRPEPTRSSNVARWLDGEWQWLAMDPKATDLLASGERVFVVAEQRLGEIIGSMVDWLPDLPEALPANTRLTIAAEPAPEDKRQRGDILIATPSSLLSLVDGKWLQHPSDDALEGGPVLRASNGTLLGLSTDGKRLWRTRSLLRPNSPLLHSENCRLHGLIEAPDHALWGFGEGSIVRYPAQTFGDSQVPPVLYETAAGLWCSDGQHVYRLADATLEPQPDISTLLAQSPSGDVLAGTNPPGRLALMPANGGAPRYMTPVLHINTRLRAVFDRQGAAWLFSEHGDEPRVAELDTAGRVTQIDAALLQTLRSQDIRVAVGARKGAWLCAQHTDGALRITYVGRQGSVAEPVPERLTRASIACLEDGRLAAIGQSGVWVRATNGTWSRIEDPATSQALWLGAVGNLLLIGCDTSTTHRSGLVTFDGKSTVQWPIPRPRLVGSHSDRLFVAGIGEILCVDRRGLPLLLLSNIDVARDANVLADVRGHTWISSDGRACCLYGPSGAPMCRISLETANPVATREVRLRVSGNHAFMPWSESNPVRFTYRWRLRGGTWSMDIPASQPLELELVAGLHEIEAVITDALGRSSPIATTIVDVAPLPLQRRAWFPWAVATIAILLLGLSAHAFVSHRRLAAQAGRLRIAVDRRTRKIRSELVRRIRVERHLRHQQRVLALLATGKPIDSALEALVVGVEERLPGWRGAAMLPSGASLLPVAMPNLTDQQRAFFLDCKLDDRHLACARAFHERRRFVIADTSAEPEAMYRRAGVGAVCAQPIVSSQGNPLGVLLMLHTEPNSASREQLEILEAAAHIAALAIESKHGETERQRLQQEMLDAQKLRSLGLLAGGIAHDFNNLLTGILGNAGLARMQSVIGSPVDDALIQVEVATNRAAELCTQLLAYSGRGRFTVKPIDLSMVVREMTQMLRLSMSRRVSLELTLDPNLPSVEADATQIRQVLMNLIGNAAEAIGDRDGLVSITTGTASLSETQLRNCVAELRTTPGRHVFVRVADSGCGMTEAVRRSMFDPFFTTKATGRGLGLAAVLGIVQGHRGAIDIESEVGRGTSITVYLPASDKPAEHESPTSFTPPALRGSGSALIVEDEVIVRDLATSLLGSVGFEVASVADGESAIAHLQEHAQTLSLVLLDIVLPRIDGQEVLRRLRAIRRELPVILSSGNDIVDNDAIRQDDDYTLFLKKPYGPRTLLDALRTILARGKSAREP